eukprot:3172990-Prymnesium_polylepis.1
MEHAARLTFDMQNARRESLSDDERAALLELPSNLKAFAAACSTTAFVCVAISTLCKWLQRLDTRLPRDMGLKELDYVAREVHIE